MIQKADQQASRETSPTHPTISLNTINPIHLVPKLPLELFKLVIPHLSRRKHDLFRCMLVSSYFNSITAPILYCSFNIAGLVIRTAQAG
jgi:hypothetical protein